MTTLRQAQHLPSHLSERYSPQAPCRMKHWSWDSSNNPQGNPWAHTCILGSIYTLRKAHRNVTKFKILLGTDQCNYSVMKVKKANAPSSQCYTGKLQQPLQTTWDNTHLMGRLLHRPWKGSSAAWICWQTQLTPSLQGAFSFCSLPHTGAQQAQTNRLKAVVSGHGGVSQGWTKTILEVFSILSSSIYKTKTP